MSTLTAQWPLVTVLRVTAPAVFLAASLAATIAAVGIENLSDRRRIALIALAIAYAVASWGVS